MENAILMAVLHACTTFFPSLLQVYR